MLVNVQGKGVIDFGERPDDNHVLDYVNETWVYSEERHWLNIRKERDMRLMATDYAAYPDHPQHSQALLDYRQALRDLPETYATPDEVVWPDNPLV